MKKISTKKIVFSGMFLALGLVLPFFTAQIPSIGKQLLPMHIPVLICGFVLGWPYGLIVGFITPVLRSILFTMPPMYPIAVAMAFELAVYGFMTGLLYKLLPKKNIFIYTALVSSMFCGRIVWGIISLILYKFGGNAFTWSVFMSDAFINAIPGIIIQIVFIPPIILALKRGRLIENVKSEI
jgi:riboflavin transporter FmnP